MTAERRRDKRIPLQVKVTARWSTRIEELETIDVNARGLFLRTRDGPELRERVMIELNTLDHAEAPLCLRGVVVHVENSPARFGVGVQFFGDAPARQRWLRFVLAMSDEGRTISDGRVNAARKGGRYVMELEVHPRDEAELVAMADGDVPGRLVEVSSAAQAARGTPMRLLVVHPRTHERCALAGTVLGGGAAEETLAVALQMDDQQLLQFRTFAAGSRPK
jgi:hypothetical protein